MYVISLEIHMWQRILWLSIAGALGTLARYGLGTFVQRLHESSFPWGTLLVNLLGCFLFGLIFSLAEERFLVSGQIRLILSIGFIGAFTTFSTYAFETSQMLQRSDWLLVAINFTAQNFFGILSLFLGKTVARMF